MMRRGQSNCADACPLSGSNRTTNAQGEHFRFRPEADIELGASSGSLELRIAAPGPSEASVRILKAVTQQSLGVKWNSLTFMTKVYFFKNACFDHVIA